VPPVMLVVSEPNSRQNKLLPQSRQNPRSAISEDLYQASDSFAVKTIAADGALVIAAKCPLVRLHCEQ